MYPTIFFGNAIWDQFFVDPCWSYSSSFRSACHFVAFGSDRSQKGLVDSFTIGLGWRDAAARIESFRMEPSSEFFWCTEKTHDLWLRFVIVSWLQFVLAKSRSLWNLKFWMVQVSNVYMDQGLSQFGWHHHESLELHRQHAMTCSRLSIADAVCIDIGTASAEGLFWLNGEFVFPSGTF